MRALWLFPTVAAAALWASAPMTLAQATAPEGAAPATGTIETAPLAPLRPRLPGGTIVPDQGRGDLPAGVGLATPPSQDQTRLLPGPADPSAQPATAETDERPIEESVLPEPDATPPVEAATGEPADAQETETVAIATEGEGVPEEEETGRGDLFKRAPPGTGSMFGPQQPQLIDPVARADAPGAVLRQLDKLTGKIETFELAAGAEATVDRLRVALTECREPVDGTTSDHIAFLQIWDTKRPEDSPVFSGWMFADSPALSAMDHPRYDLWVIRCTTVSGGASSASR